MTWTKRTISREDSDMLMALFERKDAEIARLTAALLKYGRHLTSCDYVGGFSGPDACNCGLDAALAGEFAL